MESQERNEQARSRSVTPARPITENVKVEGIAAEAYSRKKQQILEACNWRDIQALVSLAASRGGLLNDELRKIAWPILLGDPISTPDTSSELVLNSPDYGNDAWKELPRHKDEDQVQLDVNRAFIYYPIHESDAELESNKRELSDLIIEVLRRYPYLCYFQGYHDICQVFLLVLDAPWRAKLVSRLSVLRIRDFMLSNLDPATAQLHLIPDILDAADPGLRRHLVGVREPFYALAGTLTMYAHDIQTYGDIARLFDVLLTREPVFSIYMFAQIVLSRRDELFEVDDDPDMLYHILSKVPQKMDLEAIVSDSIKLFNLYPPSSLPAWRKISAASCLKTAQSIEACTRQTMEQGHEYFRKQERELQSSARRQRILKHLWLYRRQAGMLGLAALAGVVAIYLSRRPGPLTQLAVFFSRLFNSPSSLQS